MRQNKESQRLQYDVAERMRSLGWKAVEIIANDLGSSAGMASARREGFERVLSSVALGEVGIVAVGKSQGYLVRIRIGVGYWRYARSSELSLPTSNISMT